ncbi:hypothetical protein HYT24_00495 [Candidatus Pacearchaeota archaeon]|nr:hypothetical protein [Candidatus Pacearchaeota archaeon]
MEGVIKLLIGIIALVLGVFIGNFLAKSTKEELMENQKWFRLIVFLSLVSAILSIIAKDDVMFFSFLFIAIVTSRSLRWKK